MLDIITFGSASRDIFLKTKDLKSAEKKTLITEEGVCFSLGSKIDIEDIHFYPGGGGTNTATAFANFGLKTAYCGCVGNDSAGEKIIEDLAFKKIETSFIRKTGKKKTNHSVILNIKDKDRTILVYRGASELINKKDIPSVSSKWFYIAPLSGMASKTFKDIVREAKKNKIKIAANPGNSQLILPSIKKDLKEIDVLILNQEEASILSGASYNNEILMLKKIRDFFQGIIVMTKGPLGVSVLDNNYLYNAKSLKTKVVDRTGAGDAFGAGFVIEYINSEDIVKSIQLGVANAVSCLSSWGAGRGTMKKGQEFKKVKVTKNEISKILL